MQDFTHHNPTKLVFGKESMNRIGQLAKEVGNKVLVTYGGGSIKKNGIYDKVMKQLEGFEVKEFGGIEPNPRVETIRKAIEEFKSFDPDLILAIGGGSTVDGSKLLASAMHYDGDAWDFLVKETAEPEKYVPLAVVLTLSATGSEMNPTAVITNWAENLKLHFSRPQVSPVFSILDPQNLYSVPKDQTAYGAIDTYSHVLEQYINTTSDTPLQDMFAESIIKTLIENAPIALEKPDDYTARANLMYSATMALNGLLEMGHSQDWATHMIEHEISAFYDIPHAGGLAIITPRWMEVVAKIQKRDKMIRYAQAVWGLEGDSDEVIDQAIAKTYEFFKSLGVKMSLKEWNITDEHFDTITERLEQRGIGEFALKAEEIKAILEKSLA